MNAQDLVELFDAAATLKDYGVALASIGDSAQFSDAERGELARAMSRCWSRVSQVS